MNKDKSTIGIIGFGRFGRLAASVLKKDLTVKVYKFREDDEQVARGIGLEAVNLETAAGCDYVLLCTPISVTENVIKRITKYIKPGALVMDACSVKVYPCKWLKKYLPKHSEIMGTHPMFGPTTSRFDLKRQEWQIKDKQVVLCPLRVGKERVKRIEKYLRGLGLRTIQATPAEHDRQNAYTLGLVHFLGRGLKASGVKEQEIYTPGFADLLRITPHTTGDNWQLFYDMHNYNPYAADVRLKFLKSCIELDGGLAEKEGVADLKAGRRQMDRVDGLLVRLLEYRFKISERIGVYKRQAGGARYDSGREIEVVDRLARRSGLDRSFLDNLYAVIFRYSRKKQK